MLSKAEYDAVLVLLLKLIQISKRLTLKDIQESIHPQFPSRVFSLESLLSLQSQLFVRRAKYEHGKGIDESKFNLILTQSDQSFFEICCLQGFSSYKFAKLYLEKFYKITAVSSFIQHPDLIDNDVIRRELLRCISDDPFNSYQNDVMKQFIGKEYEELLIEKLTERKMCFETEEELRNKGKPKTPDIVFLIPMIVNIQLVDHVVNWIDSKAMFADEETFADSIDQFNGYCNRYGKGLVIYWFGHVEGIRTSSDICVVDGFPESWTFPTGEPANGQMPAFEEISDEDWVFE